MQKQPQRISDQSASVLREYSRFLINIFPSQCKSSLSISSISHFHALTKEDDKLSQLTNMIVGRLTSDHANERCREKSRDHHVTHTQVSNGQRARALNDVRVYAVP